MNQSEMLPEGPVNSIYPEYPGEYLEEILLDADAIQKRIAELAAQLSRDYAGKNPLLVCILKGATPFHSDLIRRMDIPLAVDFIAVASYGDSTKSTGEVKLIKDLDKSVTGQHVVIVEDIVDTGLTLNYLKNLLANREPADIRICALLSKPARRLIDVTIDYLGFDIPDEFVIGYGLDYAERYRNLPYIGVLRLGVQ